MTLKRFGLIVVTIVAIASYAWSLFDSFQKPQFQSRLELYQTDIVLQAASWQPDAKNDENFSALRDAIVGEKPLENATKQYEEVRKSAQINLEKVKKQLAQLPDLTQITTTAIPNPQQLQLQQSLDELEKLIAELDLQLGVLEAQQGQVETALKTWTQLQQRSKINSEFAKAAAALTGLWSDPARILPNAQQLIQKNLDGWFRFTSLAQLYKLQQRQEALTNLQVTELQVAENALVKLGLIATIPALTGFVGLALLIFLLGQRLVKGKASLLAQNAEQSWSTPWSGETILQVFVVGFFLTGKIVGEFLVPVLFLILPIGRPVANVRIQAVFILISYLLVASGAIGVLYLSIKRYFPLPPDWFKFRLAGKWFLWGLGGYCVALPIVIVVSLINQQLWQGQGGSNPLLQLALESQDSVALSIFFFTAAIAAPLFEEALFRGFILPSLTRYLPVWGAILASALLFAVAHLSLSEILPLFALGTVLGFVYTRSRNLLAPMLLHSLWNSGTLLSLFVLGSYK
ncbi:MAG: type II CAAX prenyl endopeptidase Rce1 family protein [Heteroscytonema crispum UTEX LB 1556]